MVKKLFGRLDSLATGSLTDELYMIAANIEDALWTAGARPGDDYNYLDLIKLAQPFLLENYKVLAQEKPMKLSVMIPAEHVV